MPTAVIDGIATRYEVLGAGPPLLMYAPGGFNATIETWRTQSVYAKIKLLDHLPKKYTCILFDRRECGQSGGRIERVTWADYVAQGKDWSITSTSRAHIMGGCMGCCPVAAFGVAWPAATLSMILFWPVGGAKYRINSHQRFAEHLAFVQQNGLAAVVALVAKDGKPFGADPRGGPWASVIRHDQAFAETYAQARRRALQADRRRDGAHAVRPRHRPGSRARGFAPPRHTGARHSGPRSLARDLRGALSRGMPAARRILGRAGRGPDGGHRAGAYIGVSG
jgi:hypothetical protein